MADTRQFQIRATAAGRAAFRTAREQTQYKAIEFFERLMVVVARCIANGHDVDEIERVLSALADSPRSA